jgi:hypothetical protein
MLAVSVPRASPDSNCAWTAASTVSTSPSTLCMADDTSDATADLREAFTDPKCAY